MNFNTQTVFVVTDEQDSILAIYSELAPASIFIIENAGFKVTEATLQVARG